MAALRSLLWVTFAATVQCCEADASKLGSLQGLKELGVVVEDLHSSIKADGLEESTIRTDVELKLRLAGIKVVPMEEISRTPGGEHLHVNVNVLPLQNAPAYAISYSVELRESVHLSRDPMIVVPGAITWSTGGVAIVMKGNITRVRDKIKDFLEEFINDYLAANPKALSGATQ